MNWDPFVQSLERLTRQRHMVALRDGMITAVPVILVGSTFLLLGSFGEVLSKNQALAHSSFGQWYLTTNFMAAYRTTMGLLSLFVAFTIAASLARQYDMPPLPQGLGAVAAMLLTAQPARVEIQPGKMDWVLPMKPLSADGLFLAILLGLLMVEWSRLFMRKPQTAPEDSRIPAAVGEAFASFSPMLTMVAIIWVLRDVLGVDLQAAVNTALTPLRVLGDSLLCVIAINLVMHVMGVFGIHGISVINAVFFALWTQFLLENTTAHQAGQAVLPHVTAYPFFQWFIWMGGAGATLPLSVLLFFCRSAHARKMARLCIVPSLFNVNEPLQFGLPIVANPLLALPFVAAPTVTGILAYLALQANLVARPFIEVPWVLPCLLGGPLATQDARALILVLVNLGISTVIWWPFLRAYDKKLAAEESKG